MGTKNNPGKFDCHSNALPDEPMFTLLARDPSAPHLVRTWAYKRQADIAIGRRPVEDHAVVDEAFTCANDMEKWREENDGKWRKPPDPTRELVARAIEALKKLPREEQDKMWAAQRESWARQDMD